MKKNGFTLAEMLIYILIGLIVATIVFQLTTTKERTPKINVAIENIKLIKEAEEKYAEKQLGDFLIPTTTDSVLEKIHFNERDIEDSLKIQLKDNGYFTYFIITEFPNKDNENSYILAKGTNKEDIFSENDQIIYSLKDQEWKNEGDILETDIPQNRK